MVGYLKSYTPRTTPQSEQIPGRNDQVKNNAGGYVFSTTAWEQAERWLILGSEGNTYYVNEQTLTKDNAGNIIACIREDGPRLVKLVTDISVAGRAPKNDTALFALALAMAYGDNATKAAVGVALPKVARIGTHLMHFVRYCEQFRGHGPAFNRALKNWYMSKEPKDLLFQAVKYQSRDGWSHRDILRLARPKVLGSDLNAVLRYIVKGEYPIPEANDDNEIHWTADNIFTQVRAIKRLSEAPALSASDACDVIRANRIPRECVPTELLKHPKVWQALLKDMPMGALIRNVATMTRNGALKAGDFETIEAVCTQLRDADRIKKARLHPLVYLVALKTYAGGHSVRNTSRSATWTPVQDIVDALSDGFYAAFDTLVPIGKRLLLGVDVSGSMGLGTVAGLPGITPRDAAAALAMQFKRTEPRAHVMAFQGDTSHGSYAYRGQDQLKNVQGFVPLNISPRMRLDDVTRITGALPFGPTDCAVPFLWAGKQNLNFDAVIIITDNETWAGTIHPSQALEAYRQGHISDCKLIAVGMTATSYSIADPKDSNSMNIVGFDTRAMSVVSDFIRGAPAPAESVTDDDSDPE